MNVFKDQSISIKLPPVIAGAEIISIMNSIDITNIDVPAIVAIFFKGFIPLVAISKPIKNTTRQDI